MTRKPPNATQAQTSIEHKLSRVLGHEPQLTYHTRQRIWNKARVATRPSRIPSARPYRALYPMLVVFMFFGLFSGYTGVVFASGPSVPGEFLYPIERQVELAWLKLTPHSRRSEVQLILLERRVYEARALLDAGKLVPDNVLQEIELLFLAVAGNTGAYTDSTAAVLSHLVIYQNTVQTLVERYPGVGGLRDVLEAANTAVTTLGGDSRNSLPRTPQQFPANT